MSHISKIELEVKDLAVLAQACTRLGLTLIRGQKHFKWYGRDGQCDHAIKVPDANYEIGVLQKNGLFELNCDFFDRNIEKVIGKQGRTARCIRTLLGAAGMKLKKRFVLEILE